MEVRFNCDPVTRLVVHPPPEAEGKRFCLIEPFQFHVDSAEITVPAGFWTDWASIPRPFRGILDRDGPWARAALAHDFLYFLTYNESRYYCDDVLYYGMVFDRVGGLARKTIYQAVRLGGGWTWNRYAANNYHAKVGLRKMPTAKQGTQFSVTVADWTRGADDVAIA